MPDRNHARDAPATAHALFGDAVGSTLVTALYARAIGAGRFGVADWDDSQARESWDTLELLAHEQGERLEDFALRDRIDVLGTIRRSQDIDTRVREFAAEHGPVHIVTLGIGLCNRAARMADLPAQWFGVDQVAVTALRSEVLPQDQTRLIVGSVTNPDWLASFDPAMPTVLIAEGLLLYLDRPEVAQLLVRIGDHFTGPARLIADVHHALLVRGRGPLTRRTGAIYHFGIYRPQQLAQLVPGWRLVGVDDTVARIGRAAAATSWIIRRVARGLIYGVVTLDREPPITRAMQSRE